MKKQLCWLMLIGALCMGFPVLTRSFITIPESIADFIKGFGVSFIFAAFILQVREKKNCKTISEKDSIR
jgi:hypothetical protein